MPRYVESSGHCGAVLVSTPSQCHMENRDNISRVIDLSEGLNLVIGVPEGLFWLLRNSTSQPPWKSSPQIVSREAKTNY